MCEENLCSATSSATWPTTGDRRGGFRQVVPFGTGCVSLALGFSFSGVHRIGVGTSISNSCCRSLLGCRGRGCRSRRGGFCWCKGLWRGGGGRPTMNIVILELFRLGNRAIQSAIMPTIATTTLSWFGRCSRWSTFGRHSPGIP